MIIYTDPHGNTSRTRAHWEIEQGYRGAWSRAKTFQDRDAAAEWIAMRKFACPHENLRLVHVETVETRTIEETP